MEKGEYSKASEYLLAALKKENNPTYRKTLGDLYLRSDKLDKAKVCQGIFLT